MSSPAPASPRPAVVLVGLMASGKTTVGRKVARLIGRRFVDADVELEVRTGRSVSDWFAAEGEPGFRAAEAELLDALLREADPPVIGAGGGVVVTEANRHRLAQPDVAVVYLHGDPAFLASRVQAKPHRPLLEGADPVEVLQEMYARRDPWYREVADAVVEVRPAHEAGEKPKWRLAEQVTEALVDLGVVDLAEVTDRSAIEREDAAPAADAGVDA
jgi:shikimate kinase